MELESSRYLRIGHENMDAMLRIFLVLLLCLQYQLLQNIIIASNNTVVGMSIYLFWCCVRNLPYFQSATMAVVRVTFGTSNLKTEGVI